MKIAVCDDEREIRSDIRRNIRALYPDAEVLEYESGQTLLKSPEPFSIIFLDIKMSAPDGMETARELRRRGSRAEIIFVTALEEYVFEAFDVGAFHYLVKPFEKARFFSVLQKAVEALEEKGALNQEDFLVIKQGGETKRIGLSAILYLEVRNRKITVYTRDGKEEFYGRLGELEKELGKDFMRTHRGYLVNFRYVVSYHASEIRLEDGSRVLLSKQKYKEFVKKYMEYMKRKQGGL